MFSVVIVLALGTALAVAAWHRLASPQARPGMPRSAFSARVEEVMSSHPRTVSAQVTVEEVAHTVPQPERDTVFAVVDARGHALGVLLWDDVMRMPHCERPARLVADVTRGPVVGRREGLDDALRRSASAGAMTAVVVEDGREPVGLLDVSDRPYPAAAA